MDGRAVDVTNREGHGFSRAACALLPVSSRAQQDHSLANDPAESRDLQLRSPCTVESRPQRLKPSGSLRRVGTSELVPFPIHETRGTHPSKIAKRTP